MAESRRLAAILFTDVVGYTALMEADEERAIRVRDRHRALLRPLVEHFDGELIEAPGDEALGELDVRETARSLEVPTLVAHVEKEQAVPFVLGRELASLIPGATLVPIPGTNHIPLGGEGQQAYLERIRDWFARDLVAATGP